MCIWLDVHVRTYSLRLSLQSIGPELWQTLGTSLIPNLIPSLLLGLSVRLKNQGGAWGSTAMVPSFSFRSYMYVRTTWLDVHEAIVYIWYSAKFWSPPVHKLGIAILFRSPNSSLFSMCTLLKLQCWLSHTFLRHGLVYLQEYWWAVLCICGCVMRYVFMYLCAQ